MKMVKHSSYLLHPLAMACTGHACLHRPQRIHSGLLGFSTGLTTIWQAFAHFPQ